MDKPSFKDNGRFDPPKPHGDWKINYRRIAYENAWIEVGHYEVTNPSGSGGIYGVVHFKNIAVAIVALDEAQNVHLVGQFRFTLDSYEWEIPEGGCPDDEAPLEAAKRELLEECGLVARQWKEILRMATSNSVTDELSITYLATGLTQSEARPEDTENLTQRCIPLDDALSMIDRGEIKDALSVASLLKVSRDLPTSS